MSYTVLTGLDYIDRRGTAHRAEPGDVIDDLPRKSIPWLVEQGAVVQKNQHDTNSRVYTVGDRDPELFVPAGGTRGASEDHE